MWGRTIPTIPTSPHIRKGAQLNIHILIICNGCLTPGVVDPNTLELDPVPRNWPNLDPDP